MAIERYRLKPDPGDREDQYAARYEVAGPLDDLAAVARMADPGAELAEAVLGSGPVLVVKYTHYPDDHPAEVRYEVVEPGKWLAYSKGSDFLYDASKGNWQQFYDQVTGD